MKKTLLTLLFLLLHSTSFAEPTRLDLSACTWTANGVTSSVPHSFTFLTPEGSFTNILKTRYCVYRTTLPSTLSASKRYVLQLDGVGKFAKVYAGQPPLDIKSAPLIGYHDYGFLPKRFDVTSFLDLSPGATNELAIVVDMDGKSYPHNGRIVPFSGDFHVFHGLYRKVWLWELGKDEKLPSWPETLKKPALTYKDGFFWDEYGSKVFLRGVNYHQYFGYDWTYDEEKERRDLLLIKEMGANAIRTAHYPKSPRFYEMCNELGLYVFTEVPCVNTLMDHREDIASNYLGYVETMVKEYGQYKCIIAWGLYNELAGAGHTNLISEANALAHRLDPNRPTYGANCGTPDFSGIPDILGCNLYWNWYADTWEKFIPWASKQVLGHKKAGSFFLTEYGCSGNIEQHSWDKVPEEWVKNMRAVTNSVDGTVHYKAKNPNNNPWHPVDYQLWIHEQIWGGIKESMRKPPHLRTEWESWFADHCGGVFIWQMFDTPTGQRNEGSTRNMNLKGMMDVHRRPKPVYEFYKREWNVGMP